MTSLKNAIQARLLLKKLTLAFIVLSLPTSAISFPGFPHRELPFCPGGGPPGWLNYFDYKRDQNIKRYYTNHQSRYLRPSYNRSHPYSYAYYGPNPYAPYSYVPRVNTSNQPYLAPRATR